MVPAITFFTFLSLALIGRTLSAPGNPGAPASGNLGARAQVSGPNNVIGSFRFSSQSDSDDVKVVISMSGLLQFNQSTGFLYHIHRKAISDADCSTALGHFQVWNPKPSCYSQNPQWCQPAELALRHGNLTGTVNKFTLRYSDPAIFLNGTDSIIGKSIVIHGVGLTRIACGTIEAWSPDSSK